MSTSASSGFRTTMGVIVAGAMLALAACSPDPAPEPSPTATPEPTASPTPEPYAGPLTFTGDELNRFLLTSDEISSLLPGAAEISEPTSITEQISDGVGSPPMPEICGALFMEEALGSVGARSVSWEPADYGRLDALQFGSEEQAQVLMDQLVAASEQCATFEYEGTATFDAVVPDPVDDVRALVGTVTLPEAVGGYSTFSAYAVVGNVFVALAGSVTEDTAPDATAVVTLLQQRAVEARAALIDELTAEPPTTEEEPEVDAAAPWGDWEITRGGVGPIRLGASVDDAIAAAGAAQVTEPEYPGGDWKLGDDSGSASMIVRPMEQGDIVASITAGDNRFGSVVQDGALLPSRGGIRVGDPVADAIAAFPEGTTVTVMASGEDWYAVASRDGRLVRFHTDRDVVEPGALIVGIEVEDATLRRGPSFG